MSALLPAQHVRIVGTGLLGASIGLKLSSLGVDVALADASPTQERLAIDYGAGRAAADADRPELVIVCVPPDVTAHVVARELEANPSAVVTDVASVKSRPLRELEAVLEGSEALSRYVGGHPMAGRERGGALSARADLFVGRPYVVAPHEASSPHAIAVLERLALALDALPVRLGPDEHDRSVALVSHVPQVVASLMAGQLRDADETSPSLAGQGVRDVTRIAASDPRLWTQILEANAEPIVEVLSRLRDGLDGVIGALADPAAQGSRRTIAEALAHGNDGVSRLPGKHGARREFASVTVMLDDQPGQLARLFEHVGEIGVNLEDIRIEHSPGANIGLAELSVVPEALDRLLRELTARGWRIAG